MTHEDRVKLGKKYAAKRWSNPTFEERFWNRVNVSGPDECWEWQGNRMVNGYGRLKRNGHQVGAHRIALEMDLGRIEPGLKALHRCNNPACCNPKHLYQGTTSDNLMDAWRAGSFAHRQRRNLTEGAIFKIREQVSSGKSQIQVAKFFGVNQSTISRIVHHVRR